MACNNCGSTCKPLSLDCLCKYAGLPFIADLSLYDDIVEDVNDAVMCLMSEECFEKICSGEETEIQKTVEFKKLWAKLFKYYWIKENGFCKISENGYIKKSGDEFSQWKSVSFAEFKFKLDDVNAKVTKCKKKFTEMMVSKFPKCCLVSPVKKTCGCLSDCGCGKKSTSNKSNIGFV